MYLPSSGDVPMASVLIKTWEKGEELLFFFFRIYLGKGVDAYNTKLWGFDTD